MCDKVHCGVQCFNDCMQKLVLPSTMRRLGEEIYESRPPPGQQKSSLTDDATSCHQLFDGQFFRSPDIHVRLLSTLIILRTINQGMWAHF